MKKLLLSMLLLSGCANTVDVEDTIEYKCGEKVVMAEFLDDESIILRVNGANTVLTRTATDEGKRYDNSDSKMTFTEQKGNVYLSIEGKTYPLCSKIVR